MRINYQRRFLSQLGKWDGESRVVRDRILSLIHAARNDAFRGIGEPRLVKELGRGVWARHITNHHFLIYILGRGSVTMHSCRAISEDDDTAVAHPDLP